MPTVVLSSFFSFLGAHPGLLVGAFLLYCFVYALSILFSGPKPSRNPFSVNHVRPPPEKIITDHKTRNTILKQRFKPQKVPENVDTIIVGSGIGGLATAVMLGRAGHKVVVLEQHDQAGGCCHTFIDKGYEFDTGIHYVGKMIEGDQTKVLLDQITEGQVTWVPMDKEYDIVAVGPSSKAKRYPMSSGSRQHWAENLEKLFPTEKPAIAKLMKLLDEGRGHFMGVMAPKVIPLKIVKILIKTGIFHLMFRKFLKVCRLTLKDALDEISDNLEFKSVCSYIFGDMGAPPSELGVLSYAQLINHYISGAFYPLGGTSEIAFQIIPVIEKYGGRVLVDAPVTKILVNEKGRANGVTVQRSSGEVNIFAKRVVSDAGVINTFKHLLPIEIAQKSPLYPFIDKVGPSISNLTVFVGMKGTTEELGIPAGNMWYFNGDNLEQEIADWSSLSVEQAAESECPLMFISFPSAKDPSWEEKYPGKSVALLITLTPWSWFSTWQDGKVKKRGEDYEALKDRLGRQMWKQTEELFPKLAGTLDYIDVGTPLSNKYYLGQPEGEMYGLDHGRTRFMPEVSMHLRPETGIPGLYLTGQDIITAGFSGALHAAALTSGAILHRNLFNDISALTKEIRKINKEKKVQ